MSYSDRVSRADQAEERLVRSICFAGFATLPLLILFVHLLVIYRG